MQPARQLRGFALAVVLLCVAAGCKQPPRKSDVELGLTPQQARGRAVYDTHCLGCHEPYGGRSPGGPGLQALYRKPYMPSGLPANDERITDVILLGKTNMPAYRDILTQQQLADLLAYLKTL